MFLAETGLLFVGSILYITGIQARANSSCSLKGSSVTLPCSPELHIQSTNWYTVHWDGSKFVKSEISVDGNRITYDMHGESGFALTINDLKESDTNLYCCGTQNDNGGHCWFYRTEVKVADLQVKVIPSKEGQTVTLMCSTSCPLTEKPVAFIWYKNGEFLYQDWSPWYQQLVSSEDAIRYSCAIKGYEYLRAPEVSVDSVTPYCFKVTYAKGRMCSHKQTSMDQPCSITYPTELDIQRTALQQGNVRLTCAPSCLQTDPQTAYSWYQMRRLYRYSESQYFTVPMNSLELSCAVKGHEDLHSAEVCSEAKSCRSVNYVSRRICALEGSSVNISTQYLYTNEHFNQTWFKVSISGAGDAEKLSGGAGRLEYDDSRNGLHVLTIKNPRKNDSAKYVFRLLSYHNQMEPFDTPGVTLVVTGLEVKLTPSAVVIEGQRVTLTCATSCPLIENTNYIWYLNSQLLTLLENQNKHLVLDPVGSPHAGHYSCAVKGKAIKSPEVTLIVQARSMMVINAVRLTLALLIPVPLLLFHLWMRWTLSRTTLEAMNPAEQI